MQTWSDVRSQSLDMATTMSVYTPTDMTESTGLLLLLHGLTGNHAVWPMRADLQTLADTHDLIIALPDGARSFWIDQAYGLNWGTWVGQELPATIQSTLRISRSRKDTLVGGLSMGGYGAFRAAFDYPQTFSGALSLSGTLNVAETAFRKRHRDLYELGFGNPSRPRPEDDLIARIQTPEDLGQTRFFATCGTEDRLIEQNRLFHQAAQAASLDLRYQEGPGGHDYQFWNAWLPLALNHLRPAHR